MEKNKFDPEGTGYDIETARKAGMKPDKTGHWASRDSRTGLILKGRGHKTWHLTEEGEKKAGYEIGRGPDGRYYSRKVNAQSLDELIESELEAIKKTR